jgi:hypothetical protein
MRPHAGRGSPSKHAGSQWKRVEFLPATVSRRLGDMDGSVRKRGLFAPRNVTIVIMLFFAAFVVSTAMKMLLDIDSPFRGYPRMSGVPIAVSAEPIRHALAVVSQSQAPNQSARMGLAAGRTCH